MEYVHKVLVGIQARSTSSRLPKKAWEQIGRKNMTDLVIEAAKQSATHIATSKFKDIRVYVALLVPAGDPLFDYYLQDQYVVENFHIFDGSENDVLGRYQKAVSKLKPDYLVRLTGDCPMIPPFLISKHITTAVRGQFDFLTNADDRYRTHPDGWDCEVLSRQMFDYLSDETDKRGDREHVTLALKNSPPPSWAKRGIFIGHIEMFDRSDRKLSVDTIEDLTNVRANIESINRKVIGARKAGYKVFRL